MIIIILSITFVSSSLNKKNPFLSPLYILHCYVYTKDTSFLPLLETHCC